MEGSVRSALDAVYEAYHAVTDRQAFLRSLAGEGTPSERPG